MARVPARRGGGYPSAGDPYGLKPGPGVLALIATCVAVWLIGLIGGEGVRQFMAAHLLLTPARAIGPEPWQLLTNGFMVGDLEQIFFLSITLIFFGNAVERMLGAGKLWTVYVAGILGGSILWGVISRVFWPELTVTMEQAGSTAILAAYAVYMSRQQVSAFGAVNMSAGTIAWIWIGIGVVTAIFRAAKGHVVEAAMMMVGMLGGGLAGWLVVRRGGLDIGSPGDALEKVKLWRLRRRYKVLQGGRGQSDDKRYLN